MTDITAPQPELDPNSILVLLGGALVGGGVAALLQVPQVRNACGRLLQRPEVKKAGREAAQWLLRDIAASLGRDGGSVPLSS